MFSATELARALDGERFGHPLYYFPSIGSTNDEAKRLAETGAPEGALVVADEQTAGRGRAGRSWLTPAGTAIAASFVLRPSLPAARLGRLSLLGGLAAARAIEASTGLSTQLKWPNDVWIAGHKVCGVLAEASLAAQSGETEIDWAVLGIGVNVNGHPPPAAALRHPATTLAAEIGRPVDRVALLTTLVRTLAELYADLNNPALLEAWRARLLWRGERVRVASGATVFEGKLLGATAEGGLYVRLDTGDERVVTTGDVSLI